MKLLSLCLVALEACRLASAFSVSTRSFARSSSLSMNVENVNTKPVVRVGVIGMGRIGLVHLEAITKAPGVIPVMVSNPTVSKAEAGKCRFLHQLRQGYSLEKESWVD
jgi:hypothetical protein